MPHEKESHCPFDCFVIPNGKIISLITKSTVAGDVAAGCARADVYHIIPSIATTIQQSLSGVMGMPGV